MRNRLVPKRIKNDIGLCLEVVSRSRQLLRYIWHWVSRKPLEIEDWFRRTTNRKWYMGYRMVTWPWKVKLVTPIGLERNISKTIWATDFKFGMHLLWGMLSGHKIKWPWLRSRGPYNFNWFLQRQRPKQRDVNANSGAIWQSLLTRNMSMWLHEVSWAHIVLFSIWAIEWSRDRWRHVTLLVCYVAVRSAIIATAWLLVICKQPPVTLFKIPVNSYCWLKKLFSSQRMKYIIWCDLGHTIWACTNQVPQILWLDQFMLATHTRSRNVPENRASWSFRRNLHEKLDASCYLFITVSCRNKMAENIVNAAGITVCISSCINNTLHGLSHVPARGLSLWHFLSTCN